MARGCSPLGLLQSSCHHPARLLLDPCSVPCPADLISRLTLVGEARLHADPGWVTSPSPGRVARHLDLGSHTEAVLREGKAVKVMFFEVWNCFSELSTPSWAYLQ